MGLICRPLCTELKSVEEKVFLPDTMHLQHGWTTRGVLGVLSLEMRVPPHDLLQCLGIVDTCKGYCEDCPLGLLGKSLLTRWLMTS